VPDFLLCWNIFFRSKISIVRSFCRFLIFCTVANNVTLGVNESLPDSLFSLKSTPATRRPLASYFVAFRFG